MTAREPIARIGAQYTTSTNICSATTSPSDHYSRRQLFGYALHSHCLKRIWFCCCYRWTVFYYVEGNLSCLTNAKQMLKGKTDESIWTTVAFLFLSFNANVKRIENIAFSLWPSNRRVIAVQSIYWEQKFSLWLGWAICFLTSFWFSEYIWNLNLSYHKWP